MSEFSTILAIAVVLVILAISLVRRKVLRIILLFVMYMFLVSSATVGMGGLRVHIEQARAEGKSEDYVAGMAARDKWLLSGRIEILVFGTGLMVLGLAGWMQKLK